MQQVYSSWRVIDRLPSGQNLEFEFMLYRMSNGRYVLNARLACRDDIRIRPVDTLIDLGDAFAHAVFNNPSAHDMQSSQRGNVDYRRLYVESIEEREELNRQIRQMRAESAPDPAERARPVRRGWPEPVRGQPIQEEEERQEGIGG